MRRAVEVEEVVGGLGGGVWRVEGGRRVRRVRAVSSVCVVVDGMVEGLLGVLLEVVWTGDTVIFYLLSINVDSSSVFLCLPFKKK